MPEVICNTSPLQYLHQLGLLDIFPALAGQVLIPPAVRREIEVGRDAGVDLPDLGALDWLTIRVPRKTGPSVLQALNDLGPGESEVLALALQSASPLVILDDGLARQAAKALGISLTGTLGLLLDAKSAGLVPSVLPLLDRLQDLRFRVSKTTKVSVLRAAGEATP